MQIYRAVSASEETIRYKLILSHKFCRTLADLFMSHSSQSSMKINFFVMPEVLSRASICSESGFPPADCGNDDLWTNFRVNDIPYWLFLTQVVCETLQ